MWQVIVSGGWRIPPPIPTFNNLLHGTMVFLLETNSAFENCAKSRLWRLTFDVWAYVRLNVKRQISVHIWNEYCKVQRIIDLSNIGSREHCIPLILPLAANLFADSLFLTHNMLCFVISTPPALHYFLLFFWFTHSQYRSGTHNQLIIIIIRMAMLNAN